MDNHGYILCKYNSNNLLETNVCFFLSIDDVYKYFSNKFNFIEEEELKESYLNYLNGDHFRNGHCMLFPKNYVFSFEYENNLYELYAINENSEYVLLTIEMGTELIGSIKGFSTYKDALKQMKEYYYEVFDDEIKDISNVLIIPYNNSVFAMIFNCYQYSVWYNIKN
jgi:hypothetical protein